MTAPPKRRVFYFRSKHDELVRGTRDWAAWYKENIACPQFQHHLGREWRKRPKVIDVELAWEPRGNDAAVFDGTVSLLSGELYQVLKPHMRGLLVGDVAVKEKGENARRSSWVSVAVPSAASIDPYRGRDGLHTQCPHCGQLASLNMNPEAEGIAQHALDDRRVYGDDNAMMYLDGDLVEELELKSRFPDLRFMRRKVIPAPLDGDILPGDPGWDGVFRPQAAKLKARKDALPKLSAKDREYWRQYLPRDMRDRL